MPELPEIETIKKGLQKSIKGLTILSVETDVPKMIPERSLNNFKKEIKWKKIIGLARKGKLLIINLNNGQNLVFHLKIAGQLLARNYGEPEDKYTHIIFKLSKGKELRFTDLRKFGWVRLLEDKEMNKIPALKELGAEPLSKDFTFQKFLDIIKGRRGVVKKFLMNQKIIAGIGNIYANEALWKARIHPERKIEVLSEKEKLSLYRAVISILKKAVRLRGTSVDRYVDAFGKKGEFEKELEVYQKKDKSCGRCGTKIVRFALGGRGTFFCPKCQKLR